MIGQNGIKIIPEILISGNEGGNGPISGLLGMELLSMVREKNNSKEILNETIKDVLPKV
jgi:hypothetical protein